MKILMMTNTYAPMVGGIEQSIKAFTSEFERLDHEVLIVAPECEGAPPDEAGVIRIHAIQNFNNSDFSMALPMSSLLPELMKTFKPDIIHCHHPFWMGDIALRLSSQYKIPMVFTYHTMFEQHMHYLPIQNDGMKNFIVELFAGYANLSDQVIAPSESVRAILLERGVKKPIEVVPTGVDLAKFSKGEGGVIRKRFGIPSDAVVIGTIGRLAIEKNLEFLIRCVAGFLKKNPKAHFLLAGEGPLQDSVKTIFSGKEIAERLHMTGSLHGQDLIDCYHAMSVFAFASLSETQGIVLIEAMAAGLPIVAIDACGVREVVKDGYNGRLISEENEDAFIEALSWCVKQPDAQFALMKENAKATTKEFARDICAQKMLKVYQEVMAKEYISDDSKDSVWYSLAERLKNEWDMFKNMMQAGGAAITDKVIVNKIVKKPKRVIANLPKLLSLSEWSAKLLRLPIIEGAETEPGLVLIQIDGFSQRQLEGAIQKKQMPFLQGLIQKEFYKVFPQYSGLPSSTPSVQGELFYGIKQIVPAFSFLDKEANKVFRMYDSDAVVEIERRLTSQGEGLLKEGSSYSNIFSGGSTETHFCASLLGWSRIWKEVNPNSFIVLVITHFPTFLRMLVLIFWEIILGIVDFGRGIFKGGNFIAELKFIYLRAMICVHLRELVFLGAKIDITRGLPIIHLNLLGYDENSHHSGPSSRSAGWALKGIDRAIEKIYRKAMHSSQRNYDVWIYSDHGQEDADSYITKYGRSVQEAIAEVFKEFDANIEVFPLDKNGEQLYRARFLGFPYIEKVFDNKTSIKGDHLEKKVIVTAIGPTGNIYLPGEMSKIDKHLFAKALVDKAKIPVVMLPKGQGHVRVWTEEGEFDLPEDAKKILGEAHPFLIQATEDLICLCHHANAGDFTFMGFRPGEKSLTFPLEKGSHAGPGFEETNAFALLPIDVIPRQREHNYLTPMDLRFAALRFLKRSMPSEVKQYIKKEIPEKKKTVSEIIRIMTYNVHSCIGTDGKISPERIARVIARHEPDIVALQELDMGRERTRGVDQTHIIAQQLKMIYHFHPSLQVEDERYGNAVLSRYPMELIRAGRLSKKTNNKRVEPRGAIWVGINISGVKINLFNTHLGYLPREGRDQSKTLLGLEWLCHPACKGPVILCGDFNALPSSQVCRNIKEVLYDSQGELENHIPKATWFSRYPVGRIDHVFISPEIEVTQIKVSNTGLDKIASDHLPLIIDIKIKS